MEDDHEAQFEAKSISKGVVVKIAGHPGGPVSSVGRAFGFYNLLSGSDTEMSGTAEDYTRPSEGVSMGSSHSDAQSSYRPIMKPGAWDE
ncbi:hypothetical protein PGT21_023820 [Puccinia graminis f. sp. tritici]|uniref:Uncharacterized protein n=1 Tax=Puccinia graminis f. sp. tritici TaxID=56615 RepID=A0A5B0NEH2_PUCGR|nr:hypothetical protein PGT21_023820 [Puccinia graminis f. sp. tritici]